jgi:hypothetical protein
VTAARFEIESCQAWGFPVSALFHRNVFEWTVARTATGSTRLRAGSPPLATLLRLDRHFVGHERGALGYILLARRQDGDACET